MKSTFDPTLFNFIKEASSKDDDMTIWLTLPMSDKSIIGRYSIEYSKNDDYWYIREFLSKNEVLSPTYLYMGKIPDNDFGFQLLKNMEMELPVITRHNRIEDIIN